VIGHAPALRLVHPLDRNLEGLLFKVGGILVLRRSERLEVLLLRGGRHGERLGRGWRRGGCFRRHRRHFRQHRPWRWSRKGRGHGDGGRHFRRHGGRRYEPGSRGRRSLARLRSALRLAPLANHPFELTAKLRQHERDVRQLARGQCLSAAVSVDHRDGPIANDDGIHQHRPQPPAAECPERTFERIPSRNRAHIGRLAVHHRMQHARAIDVDDGLGEIGAAAVLDAGGLEHLKGLPVTNEDRHEVEGAAQEINRHADHAIAGLLLSECRHGFGGAHAMLLPQARAVARAHGRCFEGGWLGFRCRGLRWRCGRLGGDFGFEGERGTRREHGIGRG